MPPHHPPNIKKCATTRTVRADSKNVPCLGWCHLTPILVGMTGVEVPAPKVREHRSAKQSLVAKLLCADTKGTQGGEDGEVARSR